MSDGGSDGEIMFGTLGRLVLSVSHRWNRILGRMLMHYYRRQLKECGESVSLGGFVFISEPKSVSIRRNVNIGRNGFFKTEGGLEIGENCFISRNVTIYTVNHNYTSDMLPFGRDYVKKRVTIEDNVWVGMNVSICPGVTIGEGAIVGMGAVVAKDVPPLHVVGGNPAKTLKIRDVEHYEFIKNTGVFYHRL